MNTSDYRTILNEIKGNGSFYRLGKTFKAKETYYYYDMGTGKVFETSSPLYYILNSLSKYDDCDHLVNIEGFTKEELLNAIEELIQTIKEEHILQAPLMTEFVGPQSLNLEEELLANMSQLTLEVTEQCNLRCKYCIYQNDHTDFHDYTNRSMTFEVAKKAIDYTYPRTKKDFYIAFYGGEPLLNFPLIKQVVDYTSFITNRNVAFSITTNATLLTNEIAHFFAKHKFIVLVSLDGPEEIHNENRVYMDGKGSYHSTISGLKKLLFAYGSAYKDNIFISMVTSGPNYADKFTKIQRFFDETDWLPSDITVMTSFVSYGRQKQEYVKPSFEMDKQYYKEQSDPLISWVFEQGSENYSHLFTRAQIQKYLQVIHRREIYEEPMKSYFFNGCCVPGARRLHVDVNGNFLPCERVGTIPYLGNVYEGFDVEKIKKYYVSDFMKASIQYCKDCWAAQLCTSCYIDCFDEDEVNLSYRHEGCKYIRYMTQKSLEMYHMLLTESPELIKKVDEMIPE